jgi:probable biosynthetic protein (TIGR04098 family)
VREADLNGASLVYFARYLAMAAYGERHFLASHLKRPLSADLVSCLSTEHRRIYYFGNATPADSVEVSISAGLLAPGDFPDPEEKTRWELVFRHDLYRASDKVLMASTLVRKSLNVPADRKATLREADRFLAQLLS